MTTRNWDGTGAAYSSGADWSPSGVPQAGDVAVISSGTVTIGRSDLANAVTLRLAPTRAALGVTMRNTVISPGDEVDILAGSNGASVRVGLLGTVANFGTIVAQADGAGVAASTDLAMGLLNGAGGSFFNFGTIAFANGSSVVMTADGNAADQFVNDGVIKISRPGADLVVANFMPVTGTGLIEIGAGAIVSMQNVGAGQTISFDPSGGAFSQLTLAGSMGAGSAGFGGVIAGFGANDALMVDTAAYDSRQLSSSGGITRLAFLAGGAVVSSLELQGTYTQAQLNISTFAGSFGTETTTIRGAQGAMFTGAPPSTSPKTFRFFDTVTGTHFFTDDPTEAATVSSTRPDLVVEGVGFNAVSPAARDPAVTTVYRFFDQNDGTHFFTASDSEASSLMGTRTDLSYEGIGLRGYADASASPASEAVFRFFNLADGTHFYTASTTERDAILTTKADAMKFEGIAFYENATPQGNDSAVYRFFDTSHGTHLFTQSSSERANIISTRPDLVSEGIAFYAPN